ncbi:TetR/AcrR family transcriptional regulator [Phycicoccus sp. HDW14]|uniref:TetR/AcrR family transcriptional regulator n=1 Tax=Phycicoccus sp. HDW14 TaxID=2714941 RepID=UPI001F105E56|nr:TetR/AcrR family transcriptional regulator [Phycicoccus sp. HDW14]
MDEVAAAAGTSKTVVYRHFTDRAGLYAAVADRVDGTIIRGITRAANGSDGQPLPRARSCGPSSPPTCTSSRTTPRCTGSSSTPRCCCPGSGPTATSPRG